MGDFPPANTSQFWQCVLKAKEVEKTHVRPEYQEHHKSTGLDAPTMPTHPQTTEGQQCSVLETKASLVPGCAWPMTVGLHTGGSRRALGSLRTCLWVGWDRHYLLERHVTQELRTAKGVCPAVLPPTPPARTLGTLPALLGSTLKCPFSQRCLSWATPPWPTQQQSCAEHCGMQANKDIHAKGNPAGKVYPEPFLLPVPPHLHTSRGAEPEAVLCSLSLLQCPSMQPHQLLLETFLQGYQQVF